MEHSREFYESVIRVIEYIAEGNKNIPRKKGEELADNYWPAIVSLFKECHSVSMMVGGDIIVTQGQNLNPLYEDCKNHLKELMNQSVTGCLPMRKAKQTSNMVAGGIVFPSSQSSSRQ